MDTIDYIYFRYYQYYLNRGGYLGIWKTPYVHASGFITVLVFFYMAIPIPLYSYISGEKKIFEDKVFWIVWVFIYALSLYRYKKITDYDTLAMRWENEVKEERKKKGILIVLAIAIPFGLLFLLSMMQALNIISFSVHK